MVKRHTKRCSTLLILREKHIQTTTRYHFTPVRMAISKKSTNNQCGISHDISSMGKSKKMMQTYLQDRNRPTERTNGYLAGRGGSSERDKVKVSDCHIHSAVFKINKDLLCSTGNSAQYSVLPKWEQEFEVE